MVSLPTLAPSVILSVILVLYTNSREAEGQGSLYRILPTGEAATSTGVPSTTPPETVTPPVTDESEDDGEEVHRMGRAMIMRKRIRQGMSWNKQ